MKRFLSLLLCLCMLAVFLTTVAAASTQFTDVADGDYFAVPVEWAVSKSITNGTSATTFSPNDTCTKAQILTFLWRAAGSPEIEHPYSPFADVNESHYYFMACLWAYKNGMLTVVSDYFEADTPCTRASTVEYMWKYAGRPSADAVAFSDVSGSNDTAKAVYWAVRNGVTNGTSNTTFSPNDTCTRGQIVTFLHRYFVEPLDTSNISIGGTSGGDGFSLDLVIPEEPAGQPGADVSGPETIPESELDPLPPPSYMDHPDWYMSLTHVDDMSDARLMAEYDRIGHVIREKSSDELGDAVYARELDLRAELDRRGLDW